MEEGGGDVVGAALRDDRLAAMLLLGLTRPEVVVVPPQRTPAPAELTWPTKRARSRTITKEGIRAAERDKARRASPTTPLSWSVDVSGASGSAGSGRAASSRPRKRGRDGNNGEAKKGRCEAAGVKRIRVRPAAKGMKHENGEAAADAIGASRSSASDKVVAAAADAVGKSAAADLVVCPKPLRCIPAAAGGLGPVVVGRQGKKKTLAELHAMEASLLQEQAGLRKELESHKALYDALLQENTRLKKMESLLQQRESTKALALVPCRGEARPAQAVQTQQADSSPEEPPQAAVPSPCPAPPAAPAAPRPMLHFDLNCVPDEGEVF